MSLTDTQVAFLEQFILKRGIQSDVPDDTPRVPDPVGNAKKVSDLLKLGGAIKVPPDANDEEAAPIIKLRSELSGMLTDEPSDQQLRAAAQIILDMRHAEEDCIENIRVRLEEEARLERVRLAGEMIEKAQNTTVTDALPDELETLESLIKAVLTVLPKDPSQDDIDAGEKAMGALEQERVNVVEVVKVRKLDEARRQEERKVVERDLLEAVTLLDKEVDKTEGDKIAKSAQQAVDAMPATPTDIELGTARTTLETLREQIKTANEVTEEARRLRGIKAEEMKLEAAEKAKVEHASPEERQQLDDLAEKVFAALTEKPSPDDILKAEQAMKALDEQRIKVVAAVRARLETVQKIKNLVDSLIWGNGSFALAEGPPPGEAGDLKNDLEKLVLNHADAIKPELSHLLKDDTLTTLRGAVATLEKAIETLNQKVQTALNAVEQAKKAAETALTSAKGMKLSDEQQLSLRDKVTEQVERAGKDITDAPDAVVKIKEVHASATALSRTLGLFEGRVIRVDDKPADALASELKALADARKTAMDALGKVEP